MDEHEINNMPIILAQAYVQNNINMLNCMLLCYVNKECHSRKKAIQQKITSFHQVGQIPPPQIMLKQNVNEYLQMQKR